MENGGNAPESKSIFASKTYAANIGFNMILAAVAESSPQFTAYMASHPQTIVLACTAMNLALRHMTSEPLHVLKPKESSGKDDAQ